MRQLAGAALLAALAWPLGAWCQVETSAVKVETGDLYPEERQAFEECAPRLTTDEQREFVGLSAPLRSEWLTYHCTGLHDRFETCKGQLTPEQQEQFMKLGNEERSSWLDANCGPTETADEPQVVELTGEQMRTLEHCGRELRPEEKKELAATEPEQRDKWLQLHCDDMYVFTWCSPGLTVAQQKEFLGLVPVNRRGWLEQYCGATIADMPVATIEDGEGDEDAGYHMMPAYTQCKSRLSTERRTEFLDLPPNHRYQWLQINCGSITVQSPALPPAPTMPNTPARKLPEDVGWPASRILAHAVFWPGLLSALSGSIAAIIIRDEDPLLWVPELAGGGVLMVIGIVAGIKYKNDLRTKEEKSYGLTSRSGGPKIAFIPDRKSGLFGVSLGYGCDF